MPLECLRSAFGYCLIAVWFGKIWLFDYSRFYDVFYHPWNYLDRVGSGSYNLQPEGDWFMKIVHRCRYLHAYIMTPVATWIGFMQSKETPPSFRVGDGWLRSCERGSTIITLFHVKINPKYWQVLSLGDAGFLQFYYGCFRWVWQTPWKHRAMPGGCSEDTNSCVYPSFSAGWAVGSWESSENTTRTQQYTKVNKILWWIKNH